MQIKIGNFANEKEFNKWIQSDGERLLISELNFLFATEIMRVKITKSIFGIPDNVFYSAKRKLLIIVESAMVLNKRHLCKDLLYCLTEISDLKIHSKAILWIVAGGPSIQICSIIRKIFDKLRFDGCRLQLHVSTILLASKTELRLNIETSFGDRHQKINGNDIGIFSIGNEKLLSIKYAASVIGVGYSTFFNLIKRWHINLVEGRVAEKSVLDIIHQIEKKATLETGIQLIGRFIPAYKIDQGSMLFPAEVNAILGRKGSSVRVPLSPKWITLQGSAPNGYRLLFDMVEVRNFQKRKNIGH